MHSSCNRGRYKPFQTCHRSIELPTIPAAIAPYSGKCRAIQAQYESTILHTFSAALGAVLGINVGSDTVFQQSRAWGVCAPQAMPPSILCSDPLDANKFCRH